MRITRQWTFDTLAHIGSVSGRLWAEWLTRRKAKETDRLEVNFFFRRVAQNLSELQRDLEARRSGPFDTAKAIGQLLREFDDRHFGDDYLIQLGEQIESLVDDTMIS